MNGEGKPYLEPNRSDNLRKLGTHQIPIALHAGASFYHTTSREKSHFELRLTVFSNTAYPLHGRRGSSDIFRDQTTVVVLIFKVLKRTKGESVDM